MRNCKRTTLPVLILFMMLCITPISLGAAMGTNQSPTLNNPQENCELVELDTAEPVIVEPNLSSKENMSTIDLEAVQNLNQKNLTNDQNNMRVSQSQSTVSATVYNPLNAPQIQFGQEYNEYLTAQGQQHLYYLNVPTNSKVTELLAVPSGLNYDIALYRINPPGQGYTGIASSNYSPGFQSHFGCEQVSAIVNAGDYYVLVEAVSGSSTTNSYGLMVVQSTSYGIYEPNDNLYTPSSITVPVQPNVDIQEDIDNTYDNDFYSLSVAETGKYRLDFPDINGNSVNILSLYQVINGGLTYLGDMEEGNAYLLDLSSGTYYIRVRSTAYSNGNNYQIKLRKRASNVQINQIMGYISAPPHYYSGQRTTFFGGNKFVVDGRAAIPGDILTFHDVQLRGVATDAQGRRVPNAYIWIRFDSSNSNSPQVNGYGYTNSNGEYYINMMIPSCYWTQRLPAGGYVFRYNDGNFIVRGDDGNYAEERVIHMFDTNLDY